MPTPAVPGIVRPVGLPEIIENAQLALREATRIRTSAGKVYP
jgi:hypothetical protein